MCIYHDIRPTLRVGRVRLVRRVSDAVARGAREGALHTRVRSVMPGQRRSAAVSSTAEKPEPGLATTTIEPSTWRHMALHTPRSAILAEACSSDGHISTHRSGERSTACAAA
jgi:hypothetical protein